MKYDSTLKSASEYAKNGTVEDWIHLFLNEDGDNIPFSKGLKLEKRYFFGPLKMPLSMFVRCSGPEKGLKYVVNKEWFYLKVNRIYERYNKGWDMPPLIINYHNGIFELSDGNHRYEALLRSGRSTYYVIIWVTGRKQRDKFIENYKEFLIND